jgi:tryptophanyl-tRNA synthetase
MHGTATTSSRPRVLSGMRPTGKLHLGNYMGALANWVKLQNDEVANYECYFFIADWHALTTDYADPSLVQRNTLDVALDWLAAGLDPKKSTIFIQSHVQQHAELHLLFSMITPLGWLERVPTYKEQQENLTGKDLSTYGFLGYPLLQAADILLYQPQFVPVGQDQVAHVELTREVARRFNSMYKTTIFPEPDSLLTPSPKLSGTDGRKMSKSYGNTIGLTEAPIIVASKIQSMSTNGQRIRQTDPGDPDLCPVGDLHKIFSSPDVISATQHGCRTASLRCEFCKIDAGKSVHAITAPIYDARIRLEQRIDETWEMLRAQSTIAAARAEQTMLPVRTTFCLSHDLLDSVRRYFTASEEDAQKARNLSEHEDWWNLPQDQRAKQLRDYWRSNLLPRDIQLSQESNRVFATIDRELEEPFLTAKKKRVFVTTSRDTGQTDTWEFEIPSRSYEVWVLICWRNKGRTLHDFPVPQKIFSSDFATAKKSLKKEEKITVSILRTNGNRFSLSIAGKTGTDITALENDYGPLK